MQIFPVKTLVEHSVPFLTLFLYGPFLVKYTAISIPSGPVSDRGSMPINAVLDEIWIYA